jgi:hypothetical protein
LTAVGIKSSGSFDFLRAICTEDDRFYGYVNTPLTFF